MTNYLFISKNIFLYLFAHWFFFFFFFCIFKNLFRFFFTIILLFYLLKEYGYYRNIKTQVTFLIHFGNLGATLLHFEH
jgi:hypothetical protein